MKKSLIVLGIAVLATLSFSSCKKDYTCECKFASGSNSSAAITNSTKATAEDACDKIESGFNVGSTDATCTLK